MKTTFRINDNSDVSIAYDMAVTGDRMLRRFYCPPSGGYVREALANGADRQVCDRLGSTGATIMSPSRALLLYTIKREYRAMRRKERAA